MKFYLMKQCVVHVFIIEIYFLSLKSEVDFKGKK